ncbi:MAG TPA: hypothetical protein VF195_04105 [Actinomycetota bacterium]
MTIRTHLAAFGLAALGQLRGILEAPSTYRTAVLRALMVRATAPTSPR